MKEKQEFKEKPWLKIDSNDVLGKLFTRLTPVEFIGYRDRISTKSSLTVRREGYYLCKCACGNTCEIKRDTLLAKGRNRAISCGCKAKEDREIRKRSNVDLDLGVKTLHGIYRYNAGKRDIEFDLNFEEFKELTSSDCYLCGLPPSQITKAPSNNKYAVDYMYNGIDRVNTNKGYNVDNCRPCCKFCNYSKHTKDLKEYIDHMRVVLDRVDKGLVDFNYE